MELKDYQRDTLEAVRAYLEKLVSLRGAARKFKEAGGEGLDIDPAAHAWKSVGKKTEYVLKRDGLGRSIPHFCLKIPTGGGKTFLAVKSLDLIQSVLRGRRTGLVLWVVPTSQIYRQTYDALRDREHPYRQALEVASAGRVKIVQRGEGLKKADVEERLVVMMLMLQASNRETQESLRMFRDAGGYADFFPPDDDLRAHEAVLAKYGNLDVFKVQPGFEGRQIKTSLGNVLRISDPVVVLDEGQKAYSELAQRTLCGFNPSMILELSATPLPGSNVLVDILGETLEKEDMIKLPLRVTNKAGSDWKETLHAAVARRETLERAAVKYESASGRYIRPIMLIQAERVGKDQRVPGVIHSEEVRDWLVKTKGIPAEQVAVKTAETDELADLDEGGLLSRDCPIRYIITKQALQEGWDCSFAYVLTVLTNPGSKTALTQLVGRVLRQPEAMKTHVPELDESYVFCFRPNANELLDEIRKGFSREGLGDLAGRVVAGGEEAAEGGKTTVSRRDKKFAKAADKLLLPMFAVREGKGWRPLSYASDIEGALAWEEIDCHAVANTTLEDRAVEETEHAVSVKGKAETRKTSAVSDEDVVLDEHFIVRHLEDIIPNPWVAHAIVERVLDSMLKREKKSVLAYNLPTILAKLRECLEAEKDKQAEAQFRQAVKDDRFRFLLIQGEGFMLPEEIEIEKDATPLVGEDKRPLRKSLFDVVPGQWFNGQEKAVVWYLDQHEKLFFWYRNRERRDYLLQGWKRHRIYPDFIFTTKGGKDGFDKVHVVETKGLHLDNPDTDYKKSILELCNKQTTKKDFARLGKLMANKTFEFNVIFTKDGWRGDFNKILKS